jgi:CHASE2 domain-containing sensor protein
VSGLTLQALLVDTLAAGRPVREPGRVPVLLITLLLTGTALTGLLLAQPARTAHLRAASILVSALLYHAVSFPVFWWKGWVLPVTSPLVLALIGLFSALAILRVLPPAPEKSP